MNTITFFARSYTEEEFAMEVAGTIFAGYSFLTILIPIMIALILVVLVVVAMTLLGVSDRIKRVGQLLEDLNADKLIEIDLENQAIEAQRLADDAERQDVKRKAVLPMSTPRKAFLISMAVLIPVLLVVLVAAINQ